MFHETKVNNVQTSLNGSSGEIMPSPSSLRPPGLCSPFVLWVVCGDAGPIRTCSRMVAGVMPGASCAPITPKTLQRRCSEPGAGPRSEGWLQGAQPWPLFALILFTLLCNRRQHVSI